MIIAIHLIMSCLQRCNADVEDEVRCLYVRPSNSVLWRGARSVQ